ncbi:hypothetical protein EDB87DRAFT_1753337 [Lactarius vividus]|nr:hypothetical protein EDB87DRAFT_1753337 [Lactarius vividus]
MPLRAIPMPARTDAGVPPGHYLALFATDHTVRNEVDRALVLVADPGAAADVHRFRLLMQRKQELFAHMRDLDIAWNNWLAGAEEINQHLRASNISSRIYPFFPQPLPRSELISIISMGSHLSPFHPVPATYPPQPVAIPLYAAWSCTEKSHETVSVSTATKVTQLDYALDLTSCVSTLRIAMFLSITRALEPHAQGMLFICLDLSHTITLIPNEYDVSKKRSRVEHAGLKWG